jgi:SAM-dependent methyltransferase
VEDDPVFRTDLYRGTAGDYDRFRMGYPPSLLDELLTLAEADGRGRVLDLACGTGQITFALQAHFDEVWAVDQEPDMVACVRAKAATAGVGNVMAIAAAAEELVAPEGAFELVAIGNAFHRLPRGVVAARALRWLAPGSCLALLWGGSPWRGPAPWQQALDDTMERWRATVSDRGRVPSAYERVRSARPDTAVLEQAGFAPLGTLHASLDHEWTCEELIGFVYSTSVLSRLVLGDLPGPFEDDLTRSLSACEPSGVFAQEITFRAEVARTPPFVLP